MPFQHVVALLERAARNRAGAHRDHVFRIGHLVVEPHDLGRHFLGHRAGHDHQVGLARRRAKDFAAEPREIVTRRSRCDHLDRATGQTELQRPDRVAPAPVVKLLGRGDPNPLLLQFAAKTFVDLAAHLAFAQSRQPLLQAQTSPSISSNRKTRIAMNAPIGNPVKATANGIRKTASTSKIRKMMQ